MLVGLLVALTQSPANERQHIDNLIRYIVRNAGFIGDGPFYVSYFSPGLVESLRLLASHRPHVPVAIRSGFSTLELDMILSGNGFPKHLNALLIWLEMELNKQSPRFPRSLPELVNPAFVSFTPESLQNQRLSWLAHSLVVNDPANMFFRILRYQAAGAWSPKVRLRLMHELLAMNEFPDARSPSNCDRRADYLWQRESREYAAEGPKCTKFFSGVDYLWVAALLMEPMRPNLSH
jgi:hypothetical protein